MWIPPAGDEAYVPAAWGTKERFTRSYNSEDKNCDHAKLSDIHVNATRVNKDGIRIWGDFTCQMEDTAFNQIHVTMLVAGIHKMFYKYLDHKVFKLNTTVLRAQITSDLQDKLNAIKRQNPPGLIEGKVSRTLLRSRISMVMVVRLPRLLRLLLLPSKTRLLP